MEEFLLISKYSIMVAAGLLAIGGFFVFLSLWLIDNTHDLDVDADLH